MMTNFSALLLKWTSYINPYQFYLVTLGILHSLPSPVSRRGQKLLKPSFFEWNSRKNEAAEAADAVAVWFDSYRLGDYDGLSPCGSTWGRKEIVCDTGAVLKAKWNAGGVFTEYKKLSSVQL